MMRQVLPPPRRVHVVLAKLCGATMWCWILWRFKHDWRDVFVSCTHILVRGGWPYPRACLKFSTRVYNQE